MTDKQHSYVLWVLISMALSLLSISIRLGEINDSIKALKPSENQEIQPILEVD